MSDLEQSENIANISEVFGIVYIINNNIVFVVFNDLEQSTNN
jgi:hypothetical protein